MKRRLPLWWAPILCGVFSALNLFFAIVVHTDLRFLNAVVGVLALSAAIYGSHVARLGMRTAKESARLDGLLKEVQQPSSPNQQPTSGTSPSPSPSASPFRTGGTIGPPLFLSLPENLPEKPNRFLPEPRMVPVVGFRSWHIEARHRIGIGPGWRLLSYNRQYGHWEPGANKARCWVDHSRYGLSYQPIPRPHAVPDVECVCGFYVLTDFDKVPFSTEELQRGQFGEGLERRPVTMMVGAVVGWGRVIQHGDEGWRAEKVQLIALLDCKVSEEHLRITNEVAASYGVPVVGRVALELLAKEYGDRLPTEARIAQSEAR